MSQRSRLLSENAIPHGEKCQTSCGSKLPVVLFSQTFSSIALTVTMCSGPLFNKTRSFHFYFALNNSHKIEWLVKFKIRSFEWKQDATVFVQLQILVAKCSSPLKLAYLGNRIRIVSFIVTSSPKTNRCQVLDRFRGQRTSDWCGSRRAAYKSGSRP